MDRVQKCEKLSISLNEQDICLFIFWLHNNNIRHGIIVFGNGITRVVCL